MQQEVVTPCCGYSWGTVDAKGKGTRAAWGVCRRSLEELVTPEVTLEGEKGVNSGKRNGKSVPSEGRE